MTIIRCFAILMTVLVLSGCAISREGIQTLLELKKDEEWQQAYLEQELRAFEAVHKAIADGEINPGQLAGQVAEQVGDPIERYPDDGLERWLYHDARDGWFDRPKIYLYFDNEERLVKWKCIGIECRESENV